MIFVILNNNFLKRVKNFRMKISEWIIVSKKKAIDKAILSIDFERKVFKTIKAIALQFGNEFDLCFANGGCQKNGTIPVRDICENNNVTLIDGLENEIQSSNWLLKKL